MTATDAGRTRIVVLNQHGDNRGDEAAMRAMVRGVGHRVAGAEFVIVHQFADRDSEVELDHPARYLPMRISALEYVRLAVYGLFRLLGRDVRAVLGPRGRAIVDAIAEADLVVSAPGGPYFGDLYADHELAHWLLVWIASWWGKPLFLYAPSCGPFRNRVLAPFRRYGFRRFDQICLREAISAGLLESFTGIRAVLTTDSAFQDTVDPDDRAGWADADDFLLVVAVRMPTERVAAHDEAVLAAIDEVVSTRPTSVVFLPQLHGTTHRDAPYLQTLADRVSGAHTVRVAPENLDSNRQRSLIAAADTVIAGRYHPAVFSIASATPVLVIAYEHKATGVATAAGIDAWATTLDALEVDHLRALMRDLLDHRTVVTETLRRTGPELRELSSRTSSEAVDLLG